MARTNFKKRFSVISEEKKTFLNLALSSTAAFFCGLLLARAKILSAVTPFGVAYTIATGALTPVGIFGLCGTLLGYITGGFTGMAYGFSALFCFTLQSVLSKKSRLSPASPLYSLIGGIILFAALLSLASHTGFLLYDIIMAIAASLVCGCSAYFFVKTKSYILNKSSFSAPLSQRESAAIIISLSVIILALTDISLFSVSVGRVLGIFFILSASYFGGLSYGSMTGVIIGLIMSLSGSGDISSYIIAAYSFGGLLAGLFSDMGRGYSAIAFMVSNAVLAMYINGSTVVLISLAEILAGGTLFILLPERISSYFGKYIFTSEEKTDNSEKLRLLFTSRISGLSDSFSYLSKSITAVGDFTVPQKNAEETVQAVCEKVCKHCKNSLYCWSTLYEDTNRNFNEFYDICIRKGELTPDDMPTYFKARCIKTDRLSSLFGLYFTKEQMETEEMRTKSESRKTLATQYDDIALIIKRLSENLKKKVTFDNLSAEKISSYIKNIGLKNSEVSCYTDESGAYTAEIYSKEPFEIGNLKEFVSDISEITSIPLYISHIKNCDSTEIILSERENYKIICAYASNGKEGNTVCGDTVSTFRAGKGKYILAVSDGMGTGKKARKESFLTVSFLETLLKSGFDEEGAIRLLNSAFILKSDEENFATADIAVIDLIKGRAEFIKAGAAPSFIKRGDNVFTLFCSSLPAGILDDITPDRQTVGIKNKDMIIMASDGITDIGDTVIKNIILGYKGDSPSELAEHILTNVKALSDEPDDMTVVTGYIIKE